MAMAAYKSNDRTRSGPVRRYDMILVAGATGRLGSEICRLLTEKGRKVRALVRPAAAADTVKTLTDLGIETVQGDLRDAASLDKACTGIEAAISTVSSMPSRYQAGENDIAAVDRDGVKQLVDSATKANVRHFIYVSFTPDISCPLRDAKREVERHLKASGMTYTILRSSYFMEAWLSAAVGFDYAKGTVRVYGKGDNPISFVSYHDVARFAVASLENPAARDAVLPLGGPEALAPRKVVAIFEKALGRTLIVEAVPESLLATQQKEATDPMQRSFSGLMRAYAAGDAVDMKEMSKRFGIRLISVADYAHEMLTHARAS